MIRADLHIHTTFSPDGELRIPQLLNLCKQNGLSTIAVTDHNVTGGIHEALQEGPAFGLKVIPGIEIDCNYQGIDLHVLGYHINHESDDFISLQKNIRRTTLNSFDYMIANLSRSGIDVDAGEVLEKAGGRLPSPELIAEVLLNNPKYDANPKLDPYRTGGKRSDMPYINFYLDYFAQGKVAYVKLDYMDFGKAIAMIKSNGGIPVVAHPGMNLKGSEEKIVELLDLGAEGVEVFNNYHDENQISYFTEIAVERNILATCGSDFHGKNKPLIRPGSFKSLDRFESYVAACVEKIAQFSH